MITKKSSINLNRKEREDMDRQFEQCLESWNNYCEISPLQLITFD